MNNKTLYIGVDIGDKGGCSFFYDKEKNPRHYIDFRKLDSIKEFCGELLGFISDYSNIYACIEKVHSMPNNGAVSSFKFGYSAGWVESIFKTLNIDYSMVTPQHWKEHFDCIIKKSDYLDKNNAQLKSLKKIIVQDKSFVIMDKEYLLENYCQRKKRGGFKKDIEFYDAIMIGKYCQINFSK